MKKNARAVLKAWSAPIAPPRAAPAAPTTDEVRTCFGTESDRHTTIIDGKEVTFEGESIVESRAPTPVRVKRGQKMRNRSRRRKGRR